MNPFRAWNAFWFGPVSARPLGAFRIVFGLVALANLGLLSTDLDYWFTDAGLLRGTESREAAGLLTWAEAHGLFIPIRPSILQWVQDPVSVRLVFAATAVITVLFTIGWRTRTMGILLYLATLSIHHRNISSDSGADVLLMLLTFYLMLSPCGAAYSLDARREARRRGTAIEPLIVPWAQRLIQIQIALIYLNTGLLKVAGTTWRDGTALHFILNNAEVRRFSFGLTDYPLAINLMTHGAVLIELALPILLWVRGARPWVMLAGLALHVGIALTINIPIFGELMVISYLTFLSPRELDASLRRLDPRIWLARTVVTAPIQATVRIDCPAVPNRRRPSGKVSISRPQVGSRRA